MTVTTSRLMIAGAFALAGAIAFSQPGFAQGKGGANAGGSSAGHLSTQGHINSNGPNAIDRDKGLDRAGDRANPNGEEAKAPLTRQPARNGPATERTK